jgi:hypothetical protein
VRSGDVRKTARRDAIVGTGTASISFAHAHGVRADARGRGIVKALESASIALASATYEIPALPRIASRSRGRARCPPARARREESGGRGGRPADR